MLQPNRTKWRKHHRGVRGGTPSAGSRLEFGDMGIKALEAGWLSSRHIEAARRAIVHQVSRGGQIYIRVFPDKAVSARPAETRMGGGKGAVDHWVAVVRRGRILFEVGGLSERIATAALERAIQKLPMKAEIVSRSSEL